MTTKLDPESQQKHIEYWLTAAEKDLPVVDHLFEKGDYHYALFFGHLVLEKALKALYVKKQKAMPPFTHRLVNLANKINLELTQEQKQYLETVTDFNIAGRYPDFKFEFYKKCTREYTDTHINKIKEMFTWLKTLITS